MPNLLEIIMANNLSQIPNNELNQILDIIALNYFRIVEKWKEVQKQNPVKFFC